MSKMIVNSPSEFELLLNWLDKDRDNAALKYEKIRRKLIQIFSGRGCHEAEALADRTFERITKKIANVTETYAGEPTLYFYGVAYKVFHEWLRQQPTIRALESEDRLILSEPVKDYAEIECLEECLSALSEKQRYLIVNYYKHTRDAKIETRKNLADELGINSSSLQSKAFRLRNRLRDCLNCCIEKKK